jgi:uncharacterized protein (DUF58 family)
MSNYFNILNELSHLDLLAKQIVEGFLIGLHKSPFHGFSVEFSEHRLYNQGESIKNIDWKVYARTDKMYSKKYEEETNLRCQLVIDSSGSMYFPKGSKENKLNFSVLAAAALIHLLKGQRDAFGLSVFTDKIDFNLQPKLSENNKNLIFAQLQSMLDSNNPSKTKASDCLNELAETIHRRSLIIIFSDMLEEVTDEKELNRLFDSLQHLKYNKHEVVLFHTMDKPLEMDFEFVNQPHEFIDMESGEMIKINPNDVKDIYRERMTAYIQEIRLRCSQYKIDFVPVDIRQGFKQVLQTYLLKRTKMMT